MTRLTHARFFSDALPLHPSVPVGGYAGRVPPRLSHGWAEEERRGIPLGGGVAMAIIDWVEVGAGNSI